MAKENPQAVIVEIIRKAEREFTGKTRLFKVFYFAHLYYYVQNPDVLTDWPIARMPQGPGIHNSIRLLAPLVHDGFLEIDAIHDGPYPEYRYRLTPKADDFGPLSDDANAAIQKAVDFVKGFKSTPELSAFTHEYSRSWQETDNGDILNIYLDVIPDDDYNRRKEELGQLEQRLGGIFQGLADEPARQ